MGNSGMYRNDFYSFQCRWLKGRQNGDKNEKSRISSRLFFPDQ